METDNSRAQQGHFIALYWEILLCSKVQNTFLFPHCQYPVLHHTIWNIFPDWNVIAGIYWKSSECLRPACLASKGSLVGSYPLWSHLLLQLTTLQLGWGRRGCFYFQWGCFQWCCGWGVSVTGVLPLPPGQGCALCPRCQGCSWGRAHTAWWEVLSLTHSSAVLVDRDGSATGNWNRSQAGSVPVPALLPCGTSKTTGKGTGQGEFKSHRLPKALPFTLNADLNAIADLNLHLRIMTNLCRTKCLPFPSCKQEAKWLSRKAVEILFEIKVLVLFGPSKLFFTVP